MTIATEIQRIKDNIANTYVALGEKGATIPEIQNSANLADTVATVTTGGGGGSSSGTSAYDIQYRSVVDGIMNDIIDKNKTNFSDNPNVQKIDVNSGVTTIAICGYTFYPTAKYVWIGGEYVNNFIVPSSATVTTSSGTAGSKLITFNDDDDERWLILSASSTILSSYSVSNVMQCRTSPTVTQNSPYAGRSDVEYTWFHTLYPVTVEYYLVDVCGLNAKLFKVSGNLSFNFAFNDVAIHRFISKLEDKSFFFEHNTYYTLGQEINEYYFQDTTGGSMLYTPLLMLGNDIPYVIKFNASTELNFSKMEQHPNCRGMLNYKIILPSKKNVTLNKFKTWGYNNTGEETSVLFTRESLEFMANNSPTVQLSGATLTLGEKNIATAGGMGSEIIQTLQSKGWTVS